MHGGQPWLMKVSAQRAIFWNSAKQANRPRKLPLNFGVYVLQNSEQQEIFWKNKSRKLPIKGAFNQI